MLSRRTFVTATAATAVVPSTPSMANAQPDTVIVVSESKAVRAFATRALQRQGYSYLEADNLWDGLRMLSSSGRDLLISYEETSDEVWRQIAKSFPNNRFITVRDPAPDSRFDI